MCRSGLTLMLAALATLGTSTLPRAAHAQFPAEVQAGTRVRAWIPEPYRQSDGPVRRQLVRGTVESVTSDTLRLSVPGASGTLSIPRASVRRLQISRGVSRPASGFEQAVGGALGGAIGWGVMNDPRRTGGPHYRTDWRAAGVGAAWGAGLGAVVGMLFPHEQWRGVRLRR